VAIEAREHLWGLCAYELISALMGFLALLLFLTKSKPLSKRTTIQLIPLGISSLP
jgi:hypothetical protein